MNSGCRVYEVEWWRWAAMVVLRVGNYDEKKLKEGIWWSEERCYEKWRRIWAWEEENTALKRKCEFRICSWGNAKISHSCEIPDREHGFSIFASKTNSHMVGIWFAFLWNSHKGFGKGPRACFFLTATKAFSHNIRGNAKISHMGGVMRKWLKLVFFSPVLPCFHHDFIPQAFPPEC